MSHISLYVLEGVCKQSNTSGAINPGEPQYWYTLSLSLTSEAIPKSLISTFGSS